MNYIIIVLGVILYIVIGGFIAGLLGEDIDFIPWFVMFWPFAVVYILIIGLGTLPSAFGKKLRNWWIESRVIKRKD